MSESTLGVIAGGWGVIMALSPIMQIHRMIRLRSSRDVTVVAHKKKLTPRRRSNPEVKGRRLTIEAVPTSRCLRWRERARTRDLHLHLSRSARDTCGTAEEIDSWLKRGGASDLSFCS